MFCVPKKGTVEYDAVKRIMDADKKGKERVKEMVAHTEEKVKKPRKKKEVKAV